MVLVALLAMSIKTVGPTEYGVMFNRITGNVYDKSPYDPGMHFITPVMGFYYFNAFNRTLELANTRRADAPAIECRTGPEQNEPDSGGQPVTISMSFVYKIKKEHIHKIYQSFALNYEKRLLMFARQAVSDVVQRFDPRLFWLDREKAARELTREVQGEIRREGFVEVNSIQLLRAAFSPKYEGTIVGIQLATQSRTTSQYRQQVVRVLKEIDILTAKTNATITKINADAIAKAKVMTNRAKTDGFSIVQDAKASGYKQFYDKLGWRQEDILKYIQIQSIQSHDAGGLMVGME